MASCVLSPSSARNIITNVLPIIFQSKDPPFISDQLAGSGLLLSPITIIPERYNTSCFSVNISIMTVLIIVIIPTRSQAMSAPRLDLHRQTLYLSPIERDHLQ
jgi:hypothetical protein